MLKYLLRRAATYLVVIFLTTSAGYFLAVTTLNPALLEQEKVPKPTPEQVQSHYAGLNLDPTMSAWDRYVQWLSNIVLHWDWGRSPNGAFINAEFGQRIWVSTCLYIAAIILSLIIGAALGVFSAARQFYHSINQTDGAAGSPEIDAIIEEMEGIEDDAQRNAKCNEIEKKFMEEFATLGTVFNGPDIMFAKKKLTNYGAAMYGSPVSYPQRWSQVGWMNKPAPQKIEYV